MMERGKIQGNKKFVIFCLFCFLIVQKVREIGWKKRENVRPVHGLFQYFDAVQKSYTSLQKCCARHCPREWHRWPTYLYVKSFQHYYVI